MAFAGGDDLLGIDRGFVDFFFQYGAVFSDQEIYPASGFVFVHVHAVLMGNSAAPITEQREGDSNLVGEGFIGEGAIHAHTQDLGVGCFQLLQILLEVFHLLGSTAGEGKHIKGQGDIFLAVILAQGDVF
jgi:hypothetical protein